MNFCNTHGVPTDFPVGNIYGCFVTSCPPEFDENWHEGLVEPSEEELLLMDMNAEVLEEDFTGA